MTKTLRQFAYPLVTVLALGAAFAAHAESPTIDDSATQVWASTKTRAQVQAELFAARADGSTKFYSISYNPLALAKSTATREEVKAAVAVARIEGTLDVLTGEDSGSFYLASLQRSREAGRILAQAK
jgi:hypothetical protein